MQRCCTSPRQAALRRRTSLLPAPRQRARGEADRVVRGTGSQRRPGRGLIRDSPPADLARIAFVGNPERVMTDQPVKPSRHHLWRITRRALSKSWDDSIFSESAQAAFWSALSLPPLLLGMLGSLAYVAPLFGPDTMAVIEHYLVSMSNKIFSHSVVHEIIEPTIADIDRGARGEVVSLGFLISLWAGSSAISAFVDSVVEAHDQTPLRHPVRQRLYALALYVVMLLFVIVTAPLMVRGPRKLAELIPDRTAGRPGLRLLPGAAHRADRHGGDPVPRRPAGPAAVTPAVLRRGPGQCGVRDRHAGAAHLPALHHRHRLHLRRAGHPDRVPVVRLLRGLLAHAGRGVQRRYPGGVAGPAYTCPPDEAVAGRAGEGGCRRGQCGNRRRDKPSPASSGRVSSS